MGVTHGCEPTITKILTIGSLNTAELKRQILNWRNKLTGKEQDPDGGTVVKVTLPAA